jgi:hypothetical protein
MGKQGDQTAQAAFAKGIERAPDQAVEAEHEQAHHADAQRHLRVVAGGGGIGDIGAKAVRAR